jgi:chromosome segregation ATPase
VIDDSIDSQPGSSRIPPIAIVLLVLVACLIGTTVYLYLDLRTAKNEFATRLQAAEEQIALLEGNVNQTTRAVDTRVDEVKGLVADAEKQLAAKTQEVESKVIGRTENLKKEIEQTRTQHQAALSEVGGELSDLRQKTDTAVGTLSGRVEGVQTEVTKNREEIERTIKELTSVKGDLGVQSGLIATNAKEVEALRQLGERNYFEFDLGKTKEPQRIGPISVRLRRADEKRNRFTLELWADDKRIEKKDKTLLEPVQFYVQGSRTPYELVVNQLTKDRIVGYVSTPKVEQRRAAANPKGSE